MNRRLGFYAAALLMVVGTAMAQPAASQTTITVTPSVAAPPAGTLSETRTESNVSPDGTRTNSKATTYRNSEGVAHESVTQTTTNPPPSVTTTRKSSTSVTQ